jgi:hypothetical protein
MLQKKWMKIGVEVLCVHKLHFLSLQLLNDNIPYFFFCIDIERTFFSSPSAGCRIKLGSQVAMERKHWHCHLSCDLTILEHMYVI